MEKIWRPFMRLPARYYTVLLFFLFLLVGAFIFTRIRDSNAVGGRSPPKLIVDEEAIHPSSKKIPKKPRNPIEIPLNCSAVNLTRTCPANYPTTFPRDPSPTTCPEYFRWIHEDLRPWARMGITRVMVENAKKTANFRLVIVNGKAYVEQYQKAFQTRDVFTLWGILQLLRKYPGQVPDLELMFDCVDWPVVKLRDYNGPDAPAPPPLFRYCGDDDTLDIVFPDWSFWGWPEINIKPWEPLMNDLKEGNKRTRWTEREPFAYWKGNPAVAETRQDLMKCNVSEKQDWNARVYAQDWIQQSREGYKQSDLASQCIHRFIKFKYFKIFIFCVQFLPASQKFSNSSRYKIYIEGSAWSVSEKYILACDSVTLLVRPHYYDFFTRSLVPMYHYWPIKHDDKCKSIKFAVDWGNSHKEKAKDIGKAASQFIQQDLKMEYVYDYMFHLLSEYAKLLRFKPFIPPKAVEMCSETMACPADGLERKFMMESLVKGPAETNPCTMPPPYGPASINAIIRRQENSIKQLELWEKNYWEDPSKEP